MMFVRNEFLLAEEQFLKTDHILGKQVFLRTAVATKPGSKQSFAKCSCWN